MGDSTMVRRVGPAVLPDGEEVREGRISHEKALVVAEIGGKYWEHLIRGNLFIYSTAATGITPAAAGTSNAPMIWNPSDSGKVFVPLQVNYGGISGTVIVAHFAWGYKLNCGAQTGTAAPIVSFTAVTPINCLLGSGKASKMNFAAATCSLTGNVVYGGNVGVSAGGANAAGPLYTMRWDLHDGLLAFPPGTAFFPCISNGAIALVSSVTVIGAELPMPGQLV